MAAGSEPTSLRRCASNYVAIYNRYGCKAGSTEACTKGFAAAIAAVFHAGGGTVHVPGPGAYIAAGVRAQLANVRPHGSSPTRARSPPNSTRACFTRDSIGMLLMPPPHNPHGCRPPHHQQVEMRSNVVLEVHHHASINASSIYADWAPRQLSAPPCAEKGLPGFFSTHGVLGGQVLKL